MSARLLLTALALLVAAIVSSWVFRAPERDAIVARAAAPVLEAGPEPSDVDAVRPPSRDVVETEPVEEEAAPAPEPLEERVTENATGSERVLARVRLLPIDEADAEAGFLDGIVQAQSWLRDGDVVHLHEAPVGPDGVATFEFPGAVHVDWVRFEPRSDSGLAIAVGEFHVNLDEGDLFETTLEVGPAGALVGRVVRLDGKPAEGVPVHAYFENTGARQDGQVLADWYPPHAATTSAPDGRFSFANLGPGDWYVGVPTDTWLQVQPHVCEDLVEGDVQREATRDVGTLVVTRTETFDLTVVDAAGRSVDGALATFEPIRFASSRLVPSDDEDRPSPLERWVSGRVDAGPRPIAWEGDSPWFRTDEHGTVECRLVAGTWDLRVQARNQDWEEAQRFTIEVPCDDRTVALASVATDVAGVVVSRKGEPIARARVEVRRGQRREHTTTDVQGRFELGGLTVDPGSEVRIDHIDYLAGTFPLDPTGPSDEPPRYELDSSESIRVRLVSENGPLPEGLSIGLTDGIRPTVPAARAEAMAAWYHDSRSRYRQRYSVGRNSGAATIRDLFPGEYQVSLFAPVDRKAFLRGKVRPLDDIASWTLATGADVHELVVDLSAYRREEPPRARLRGVVRDAVSGEPVVEARVLATRGTHTTGSSSDEEGRFAIHTEPGAMTTRVLCEGYLPWYGELTDYGPGDHALDPVVVPGGNSLALRFLGRRGGALPDLRVMLRGERPDFFALFTGSTGERQWHNAGSAPEGRIELGGLPAGPLTLDLVADGFHLGQVTVDVVPSTTVQELDVHLEHTVEELRERARAWLGGDEGDE